MTVLANRRHRITLMREVEAIGAGGRISKTTPILADAWAEVQEGASGAEERADRQIFPLTARFTVRYNPAYQAARVLGWRGALYRISGTERSLMADQSLIFQTRLIAETPVDDIEGETP